MATRILPHNLPELWHAQIAYLRGERFELFPDFFQGGEMDVSAYDDGRGKVEIRAHIEPRGEKRVVIREIPYTTTSESLIASIEAAAQKGRVKVASIDDYTTDTVEIELKLPRGVTAAEVIPQLYAYTDCCVSVSSNMVVIRDGRPVEATVSEVLQDHTERLREQIRAELEWERRRLLDRKHWLTLEQIFVEKRVYKRIEDAATDKAVRSEVLAGMKQYRELFVRPMEADDVKRLLELRIRRISAYDIEKNREEIAEGDRQLAVVAENLADLTGTTIRYVEGLIEQFGGQYPRRTRNATFEAIEKKSVARQSIKLGYDRGTGFFGSAVKGATRELLASEFDLILGIADDGSYRVMTPPEKLLFSGKLLYLDLFDPEAGLEFTLVYRDRDKNAFGKRVRIHKFIRNREYQLIKDKAGKIDLFLLNGETGVLSLDFVRTPRQRVRSGSFDLATLEPMGVTARGVRLARKAVSRIKLTPAKPQKKKRSARIGARQTTLF
jgi:topoisomerase-4 subunit A